MFLVVNKAPANLVDSNSGAVLAVFPETGVYFVRVSDDVYVSSLALPAKTTVVPIPDKYIRKYILADDSLVDLTIDKNKWVDLVIAFRNSVKLKMDAEAFVHVIAGNGICTVTKSNGRAIGFIPSGMMGKVYTGRSSTSMFTTNQDYGVFKQITVEKGESLPNGISVGNGGVPVILNKNGYKVNGNANDGDFVGIAISESGGTALLQTSGSITVKIRTSSVTTAFANTHELVTKADEGKLVRLCAFNDSNTSATTPAIVKYKAENNNSRLAKIISVNASSGTAQIWLY